MKLFPYAHATHPQWRMAAALVLAQLRAQMALPEYAKSPCLGLLYITDHYADEAEAILKHLSAELSSEAIDWAGTVGVGIAANNVEYFDEPAMCVMLCDLHPGQYRVFSGVAPLSTSGRPAIADRFEAHTALVHADGGTPELAELIAEMAERTRSGYVFGGLAASRHQSVQFSLSSAGTLDGQGAASGVFHGGLSGVAFGADVGLVSRVTQGAQPVDRERTVTASDGNLVLMLDDEPALDVLLRERVISLEQPEEAMPRLRATLVGLSPPLPEHSASSAPAPRVRGQFGTEVLVRHLIGLDPGGAASRLPTWRRWARAWPSANATPRPRAPTSCACAPRCVKSSNPKSWACRWRRRSRPPTWRPARMPRVASPGRCTSAARGAAGRISAAPAPSFRWCAARSAMCRWWVSSPVARSLTTASTVTPACSPCSPCPETTGPGRCRAPARAAAGRTRC